MQDLAYRAWLTARGKEAATLSTSASMLRRIENAYGNLETGWSEDGLESVMSDLAYSGVDRKNNEPNPSKLQMEGDLYNGLASARTHLNYYRQFLQDTNAGVPLPQAGSDAAPAEEPTEAILSLERDLNAALRQNIAQIEPGLTVIDDGRERAVASGRIDILAQDAQGRTVVIELKAVKAPRDAVAQVLAYMGDIQAETAGAVRGLLIAPDFDPRAISAARMVPALALHRFSFVFSFQPVGQKP